MVAGELENRGRCTTVGTKTRLRRVSTVGTGWRLYAQASEKDEVEGSVGLLSY